VERAAMKKALILLSLLAIAGAWFITKQESEEGETEESLFV